MVRQQKIGFGSDDSKSSAKNKASHAIFEGSEFFLLSNTGHQGGVIFSSQEDYDRFEAYLYLLNAVNGPRASNFFLNGRERGIFEVNRGELLVAIGAYSFTPKGFYILARAQSPGGISKFMQKLQTAYTMYFNLKYQRSGRIFHSGYHAEKAQSERHLKYLFCFTHMHPAVLFDRDWEEERDHERLREHARAASQYRYSSIGEYVERKFRITSPEYFPKFVQGLRDSDRLVRLWISNS